MKTAPNEKDEKPKNEGQFGLVSDERMAELKELLRKKLKEEERNKNKNCNKFVTQKKDNKK